MAPTKAAREGDRAALVVLALLAALAALRGLAAAERRRPSPPAHLVPLPAPGCGHCHVV